MSHVLVKYDLLHGQFDYNSEEKDACNVTSSATTPHKNTVQGHIQTHLVSLQCFKAGGSIYFPGSFCGLTGFTSH